MKNISKPLFFAILFCLSHPTLGQDPHDGQYLLKYCKNPSMSVKARRYQIQGTVTATFDINAQGLTQNLRFQEEPEGIGNIRFVKRALKRWRYYAFIADGAEAERKDVVQKFIFRVKHNENEKQDCSLIFVPNLPSTAGDPQDGQTAIKTCYALKIPSYYDDNKTTDTTILQYDISPSGIVRNVTLQQKAKKAIFDKAALKAIEEVRYHPFKKHGQTTGRKNVTALFSFGKLAPNTPSHSCFYAAYGSSKKANDLLFQQSVKDLMKSLSPKGN